MSKEISITLWNIFNDRNAISSNKLMEVFIDSENIVEGKPLPISEDLCKQLYLKESPIVTYYDGEALDFVFEGVNYQLFNGNSIEISSCDRDNIYVRESISLKANFNNYDSEKAYSDYESMFRHGSFNALVKNALPACAKGDKDAVKYLMWCVTVNQYLFLLSSKTLDFIEKQCKKNNPYAYFVSARCHYILRNNENYSKLMTDRVKSAYYAGIPEAAALMAEMYRLGEFGLVDMLKYQQYINQALDEGCEFAMMLSVKRYIYGGLGFTADKDKAFNTIDAAIKIGEETGSLNPHWYFLKGQALFTFSSSSAALPWYKKAVDNGCIFAYSDYALATGYNDNQELVDKESYLDILNQGKKKRDANSILLLAINLEDDYDTFNDYFKWINTSKIKNLLTEAYNLGSAIAAVYLGNIYYYGKFKTPENNDTAFEWYSKGALLGDYEGFEMLFVMVKYHYVDKDENFKDMCALYGTRLGSKALLSETVMAYTYGRLTEFASEIEQYYCPIFDNEEGSKIDDENDKISALQNAIDGDDAGDDLSDDGPDDDGRFDAWA